MTQHTGAVIVKAACTEPLKWPAKDKSAAAGCPLATRPVHTRAVMAATVTTTHTRSTAAALAAAVLHHLMY
jgi:hypothetical protein